ncbi:MAG: hypothetical protein WA786_06945 [Acidimicrobiales bacterium]
MTSEPIGLGAADADARWIGIRRHQAVLVVCALGLVGDYVVSADGLFVELFFGLALLFCAVPLYDETTAGEWLLVAARYVIRPRWTHVRVAVQGRGVTVQGRSQVVVQGYELRHRGRLDLSGHDVERADDLMTAADAMATSDRPSHVSLHVDVTPRFARTLLTLEEGATPPEVWTSNNDLVREVAGVSSKDGMWLLERWRYVRSSDGLARVIRIRDFSAAPPGRPLLERLQQSGEHVIISVHVEVVGGSRARRIAERAVHRTGSDGAASSSIGFRRTARAERGLVRLAQREALVASGRALLKVGVYVVVHAPSRAELRTNVEGVLRRAHDAGLRCERGGGRQSTWFCFQLPGGTGR